MNITCGPPCASIRLGPQRPRGLNSVARKIRTHGMHSALDHCRRGYVEYLQKAAVARASWQRVAIPALTRYRQYLFIYMAGMHRHECGNVAYRYIEYYLYRQVTRGSQANNFLSSPPPFLPPFPYSKPQLSVVPTRSRARPVPCTRVWHRKPGVDKQGRLLRWTRGRLCCPRISRVPPFRPAWRAWRILGQLPRKRVGPRRLLLRIMTLNRAHGGRARYVLLAVYSSTGILVVVCLHSLCTWSILPAAGDARIYLCAHLTCICTRFWRWVCWLRQSKTHISCDRMYCVCKCAQYTRGD